MKYAWGMRLCAGLGQIIGGVFCVAAATSSGCNGSSAQSSAGSNGQGSTGTADTSGANGQEAGGTATAGDTSGGLVTGQDDATASATDGATQGGATGLTSASTATTDGATGGTVTGGETTASDTTDGSTVGTATDGTSGTDATAGTGGDSSGQDTGVNVGGESNVLYVHPDGTNSNPGTVDEPLRTIQWALTQAAEDPQIDTIRVAEGTYTTDYANNDYVIMLDGVSLYGGYRSDWMARDPAQFVTRIVEVVGGASTITIVEVPDSVGPNTVFEGFHVGAEAGAYRQLMVVAGSATIRRNVYAASPSDTARFYGIVINGLSASPNITSNVLDMSAGVTTRYAIHHLDGAATIANNVIVDDAFNARIVYVSGGRPWFVHNTVYGGHAVFSNDGRAARIRVENNIFHPQAGAMGWCGEIEARSEFRNNVLACQTFSVQGTSYNSIMSIESQIDSGYASGNIRFLEPILQPEDLHLTAATPCTVTRGGLDVTTDISTDMDGRTRTVPMSVGAYEWDGDCF